MPKYLLIYEKNESVRWLGHLDILRAFERAVRRATLPIAFSNGFNPRERIAFASALSTGITGGEERAMLELTEVLPPDEISLRLNATLPPGIRIGPCQEITDVEAKVMLSGYDRGVYEMVCGLPEGATIAQAETAVSELMALPAIILTRERLTKSKTVDIRPNLYALSVRPHPDIESRCVVTAIAGQGEGGTARPNEIVEALTERLPGLTLRRTHRAKLIRRGETIF